MRDDLTQSAPTLIFTGRKRLFIIPQPYFVLKNIFKLFTGDKPKNENLHPGVWIVEKLMSGSECDALIRKIESGGFKKARQFEQGRHNEETFIMDNSLGDAIVNKLKEMTFTEKKKRFRIVQITRPLEFYKYNAGDFIKVHTDAAREVVPGQLSSHTLVIYLNDDMEGGETFFSRMNVKIKPGAGNGLLFRQELDHEGSLVREGKKYILRCACQTVEA